MKPSSNILVSPPWQKICMHLNKTEGRDKLFKVIQFWVRFLAYHTQLSDEILSKRLTLLWRGILQARKIFWWGKSIIEFQQVRDLLVSKAADETDRLLRVFQRGFLGLRWAMENAEVLGRMGVIKIDYMSLNRKCKLLWFLSGCCGISAELRLLEKGRAQRREEGKDEFGQTERKRIVTLVQLFGDLSVAMHVTDIPQHLTGGRVSFNDGIIGAGGGTAAMIQCYNIWNAGR